jgi:hypothetical protein
MSDLGRDEFDARTDARKARWETLPDVERSAIRARFDADNPMPPGSHVGLWELIRRRACLDLMETDRPIILDTRPPASAPVPDPPAEPPSPSPLGLTDDERRDFLDSLPSWERSRFEACSPARLDEIVLESRIGVLKGDRFGWKPAPVPEPIPELELAWSFL